MLEFHDYLRAPSSVQLLLDMGEQLKIPKIRLLAGSGLTLTRLADVNSVITPDEELQVIKNLLFHLIPETQGLGLTIGLNHQLTTYGILGYALMSSATGFDVIHLVKRFLPLTYTFVKIHFLQLGTQYTIHFQAPEELSGELQRFVVERAMAATARVISDIYENHFKLDAFHLKYTQPEHNTLDIPLHILSAAIEFNQKDNILRFESSQLQHPLPHANSVTAAMCERLCLELIHQRRTTLTTTMIVHELLMNAPVGILLNLQDIAAKLNISERTLKRRLHNEQSSFRQIQNSTLQHRAEQLLMQNLSLSQIAEILGFSDLSTFSQAYKRWTGIAPSHNKSNLNTAKKST